MRYRSPVLQRIISIHPEEFRIVGEVDRFGTVNLFVFVQEEWGLFTDVSFIYFSSEEDEWGTLVDVSPELLAEAGFPMEEWQEGSFSIVPGPEWNEAIRVAEGVSEELYNEEDSLEELPISDPQKWRSVFAGK